jgi:SAM-dependent methyltransferase
MAVTEAPSLPFLALLACPLCRGPLAETADGLDCTACARTFPVSDGVADLLPAPLPFEQAPGAVGGALSSLMAIPAVYDAVQHAAGAEKTKRRLRRALRDVDGAVVLDVGAGTGAFEASLPSGAQYVWLDSDREKLAGFRARSTSPAVLGDATHLPFANDSVDWAISAGVSHHLDDAEFGRMLDEMRRVTRAGIVFIDAVATARPLNRLLWRYDRGRDPRSARDLWRALDSRFDIVAAEEFSVLHRYLLVRAG